MKNLLEMIRAERHRRSGSGGVRMVNITSADPVHARIGTTVLEKSPDESMEAFEARVKAEVKADCCFLIIGAPDTPGAS